MTSQLDPLWPPFASLWVELRRIAPGILLTGGYGLFLKQGWLLSNGSIPTIVGVHAWHDQIPRSTQDLDFIAEVGLIASPAHQRALDTILVAHRFEVVAQNARWQFSKQLDSGHSLLLDFHTPTPSGERRDVRVESRRVKPQPSLQSMGIHGHENRDAVGCDLRPFSFPVQGLDIVIPNPVSQAIMKLTAMRDRWARARDATRPANERQTEEAEAQKHAQDVFRVIAMMTRAEYESAPDIAEAVRNTAAFAGAKAIFDEYLATGEARAMAYLSRMWRRDHLLTIRGTLAAWFNPADTQQR